MAKEQNKELSEEMDEDDYKQEFFPIYLELHRADLYEAGFDTDSISDAEMRRLAAEMATLFSHNFTFNMLTAAHDAGLYPYRKNRWSRLMNRLIP